MAIGMMDVFNHFFSGFPSSWLAVPFSDTLHRDHLCNSIGLFDHPEALLVDSNQKVVLHRTSYGNNGFYELPFCDPDDMYNWWKKYTQLDLILDLDSHYVFKTNNYDSNIKVSISELKEKVVALYLCFDGSFIRTLDLLYQDQEFEVVLVYLPYKEGVNPSLFQEAINNVLHILNITNWCVSPFDDFVSRRLWEAIEFSEKDNMVILDPHMNIADPFAKCVIDCCGVNSYPFTRESLVLRELEALGAFTIESLLVYGSRDHVLRIDNDNKVEEVPTAELQGKNVVLYIDNVERLNLENFHKLLEWYNSTKATRVANDFEVVFVSTKPFGSPMLLPVPMPWLLCPFDLQHTSSVSRKTLKTRYSSYVVPFGKDGHIIKSHGMNLLDKHWPDGFPPYRGLCKDIVDHFEDDGWEMDMTRVFDPYWSQ